MLLFALLIAAAFECLGLFLEVIDGAIRERGDVVTDQALDKSALVAIDIVRVRSADIELQPFESDSDGGGKFVDFDDGVLLVVGVDGFGGDGFGDGVFVHGSGPFSR